MRRTFLRQPCLFTIRTMDFQSVDIHGRAGLDERYFRSKADECLTRNQQRTVPVPDVGILTTASRLELPTLEEGFDNLKYVRLTETSFVVEEWNDEV